MTSPRLLAPVTAVFLAVAATLAGLAFAGSDLLEDRSVSVPLVLATLGVGVLGLLGWSGARKRARELAEAEAQTRERLEAERQRREAELRDDFARREAELRQRLEQTEAERQQRAAELREARNELAERENELRRTRAELEGRLREREQEANQERRARMRAEQSRREEKEWALHLRREVVRLQRERGTIGDTSDVRQLVLRIAINLVGAEKGLLLSREDLDADRLLDVVAHLGFENDPKDSAVAQRFANEVIEKDVTIREDDAPDIARERRTPADDEIQNLLAIPIYIADEFSGAVVLVNKEGGFHEYDDDVLLSLGDHAGAILQNERLRNELHSSYVSTVRVLADAIEAKDRFLRGHADEVAGYVAAVAERLGLEPKQRDEIIYSSLLHDVGKLGISERILLKPSELTPEERSVVQLHPRIGYRLIQQVPALRPTQMAILHHHERYDGDGYPAGLRGEEIPVEARIIAVADAFSAMTADRPYRGRMSLEEACAELERCAGTQFDPVVVRLFVEEVRRKPPSAADGDALHQALADPELEARKDEDDPILGIGSLSMTDNLTLLYSHRYLHEVAEAEAHRASVQDRPFSVIIVELSDLPRINREQGYAAGDDAIRTVARTLQRVAVRCGGTACRYGGRRLAIIAPGDEHAAEECANEISSALADGPAVRVVVATWRPGESGEEVIDRARSALTVGSYS